MSDNESSPRRDIKDVAMDVQADEQQESKSKSDAEEGSHSSSEIQEEIAESASTTDEEDGVKVENDGGEPPGPDGWHTFPFLPAGGINHIVLHNGDAEWLDQHKENFPLGIRGPEGYIWAKRPQDLLWAECSPNYITRMSASQLHLLDSNIVVQIFKKGEEDLKDAKPILKFEGDHNRQQMLELLCGKPTIIPSIPYHVPGLVSNFMGPDRLNVHIPFHELPSTLDVFDEDDITNPGSHDEDDSGGATFVRSIRNPVLPVSPDARPIKYRLVDLTEKHTMKEAEGQATHATLIISKSRRVGAGNSARVYEGQISLEIKKPSVREDQPPSMRFPSKLRIIAKVGTGREDNKYMQNEAKMYHSFPEHFSREYTGFQLVKPSHFPHRLSQIVPYFYGFYEPVEDKIKGSEYTRAPIILMEDCGTPINPSALTQYQKAEIVSMIHRMHKGGFVHHSVAPRNILVQAGPLDLHAGLNNSPQWARSLRTPSFRLVDFGRSKVFRKTTESNSSQQKNSEFSQIVQMTQTDITQLEDAVQIRDIPRFV